MTSCPLTLDVPATGGVTSLGVDPVSGRFLLLGRRFFTLLLWESRASWAVGDSPESSLLKVS
jgi:hypothetical protein